MPRRGRCARWMHGQMNERGLRMTQSREALLDVLGVMKKHSSAEEIYFEAHKRYPRIGLTTVYRTLELLVDMGIVQKIAFGDGRARYELISPDGAEEKHHHHLVCTECGRIIDYSDFSDKEIAVICGLQKDLEKKFKFTISNHIVQFYGTCRACTQKT